MSAAGLIPVVSIGVILIVFVGMVIGKRRAQRSRGER
jgi:hypothetical protein